MRYTYKNINLNVSHLDYVDFMGDTVIILPSEFIVELIEDCCTFEQFFLYQEMEELFYNELDEDIDKALKYFKNIEGDIEVRHSDAIIAVYEYCLCNESREFSFDVSTENISWVIHDILHAKHDAAGCTVYVNSDVERDRIIESLRITKELFPSELPDIKFLNGLESQFNLRFGSILDLDEFKYAFDEMEEY